MKKCPKCGSEQIAPILYGLPVRSEELNRKLENREIFLGGCRVSDCDPKFHCFGCGENIGTPPIIRSEHKSGQTEED